MKKSVAMKWAKALRSGKYKQTKGCLQDTNGYCCLGVLCEVAKADGVRVRSGHQSGQFLGYTLDDQPAVSAYAGIHSEGIFYVRDFDIDDSTPSTLAGANDRMSLTFDEIADIIENEWENIT